MKLSKIALLMAMLMMLTALSPKAFAEETEATEETVEETVEETKRGPAPTSGTCGENLTWEIYGSTLTISGSGEMEDGCPWEESAWKIKTVILDGEITYIGAGAFTDFEEITGVDFGGSLKEIGEDAFRGCTNLKEISLPDTFRRFGQNSFAGCESLSTIHCGGIMPSFKAGCIRDCSFITIYYPGSSPWPQEEIQRLMTNFAGRLDVFEATSETPKPVEVKPEIVKPEQRETEPEVTEPEETTAPETQATVPETVAATQPPVTIPPETTVPATVPGTEPEVEEVVYTLPTMVTEAEEIPEIEEKGLGGGIVAVVLIAGVLTFFVAGALVMRSARRKGGKYGR